jgi:hypothetical protein
MSSRPTKRQRNTATKLALKDFSEKEMQEICVKGKIMTPISEDGLFGGLIKTLPHKKQTGGIRINVLQVESNYAGFYSFKNDSNHKVSIQKIVNDLEEKGISTEDLGVEISGTQTPMAMGMTMDISYHYRMKKALEIEDLFRKFELREIYVIFKPICTEKEWVWDLAEKESTTKQNSKKNEDDEIEIYIELPEF